MTKIGIAGDWHGVTSWAMYALDKFNREGVTKILHAGDLGIWPGQQGALYLKWLNLNLIHHNQTLYVTPGNHDDYDQINATPIEDDGWQHILSNILLAPRGHRWEWEDRSFVSLGGAPSVDRTWRMKMMGMTASDMSVKSVSKTKIWWPEEAITSTDVAKVVEGGEADIMIGHDAPFVPGIEARIKGNPHGFQGVDLTYAFKGRTLMQQAFSAVKPKIFVHGHYHFLVSEMVGDTHVLGLDKEYSQFNIAGIDLDTMTARPWDIKKDYNEYTRR